MSSSTRDERANGQSHDLQEVQVGVLLGLHGPVDRARHSLVQLQPVPGEVELRGARRPVQVARQPRALPARAFGVPACPPLPSCARVADPSPPPPPFLAPQYYNRWANHELSAKLDREFYAKTEKKMEEMQLVSNLSWIEVQFAKKAVEMLTVARGTLKWTYAMAF